MPGGTTRVYSFLPDKGVTGSYASMQAFTEGNRAPLKSMVLITLKPPRQNPQPCYVRYIAFCGNVVIQLASCDAIRLAIIMHARAQPTTEKRETIIILQAARHGSGLHWVPATLHVS